jgi:hypothetical protein
MAKVTGEELGVPAGGWIQAGDARMTPASAEGSCGAARWSLRFASDEPELRHLPRRWLYRTPLPPAKLTSPMPAASFEGVLELSGREAIEVRGWPGMVGHNWGSHHAERWIWLHGVGFPEQPEAWLDVAVGRLRLGGRMTPWTANGALSLDGRRYRLGGLIPRGVEVAGDARGCVVRLAGGRGLQAGIRVEVPEGAAAAWRYADPDGEEPELSEAPDPGSDAGRSATLPAARPSGRDVVNCSVAALELTVRLPGGRGSRTLRTAHCGAYELGVRSPI